MRKGKDKEKGCCKSKVVLSLASLIMLIALALGVNAAIDCNITIPSTVNVGSEINASFNVSGTYNTINVAFEARSASTANSSFSLLGNVTNSTKLRSTNLTIGDLGVITIEDASDYEFRGTCYADGGGVNTTTSATTTGIIIDRGNVPSLPTTLQPTARQTSRTQTIQAIVNGVNTTSCRLTFIGSNPGSLTYTMTNTGNNCSLVFSSLASTTFRYTISATDGTNRSAETDEATFNIATAGASGAKKYIAATGGSGSIPSTRASSTAQQRAFGQQGEDALDRAIAKAPANAQQGLTNAKNAVTSQYKGKEAFKTWTGTGVGCGMGALGLVVPPMAIVTIPVGCVIGHLVGVVI